MPNAFLFFGQTNNVSDKTIGAIPMNSLQEYANTFNANSTRFGDIYNAVNRPLLDAGSTILMNINRQINLRLPPRETTPAPINTPPIVQQQPPTQKASVINSIGNWFGGIWGAISDFFGYMFWGERAGAVSSSGMEASGSGAKYLFERRYYCPALPNPVPDRAIVLTNLGAVVLKNEAPSINLVVRDADMKKVEYSTFRKFYDNVVALSPLEYTFLEYLFGMNDGKPRTPRDLDNELASYYDNEAELAKYGYTLNPDGSLTHVYPPATSDDDVPDDQDVRQVAVLSQPKNPYDCLRIYKTWFDHGGDEIYYFNKMFISSTALGQPSEATINTRDLRKIDIDRSFDLLRNMFNNKKLRNDNLKVGAR